ncbi:MAG TPA: hypothetical protein VGR51_06770, partial [Thermoplasmata archaeon]|nr:hypothetical protein [Thermoplasmata archaeon]
MGKVLVLFAALGLLSSLGALLSPDFSSPAPDSTQTLLWEAYSKGAVTITQIDVTYDAGGQTVTNTLGYAVRAIGSLDV